MKTKRMTIVMDVEVRARETMPKRAEVENWLASRLLDMPRLNDMDEGIEWDAASVFFSAENPVDQLQHLIDGMEMTEEQVLEGLIGSCTKTILDLEENPPLEPEAVAYYKTLKGRLESALSFTKRGV
jgi:hypothetical protein